MRTIVAFVLALLSAGAMAQDRYPTRPIRLLIGFPPGAGMDAVARPYAAKLGELLGQPVVVENRPGAGGAVSNAAIAHAPADGYTLGFGSNGDMVIVPLLIKVDYDPATSFTPISLVSREEGLDRKSTRLNSSHSQISYAVFCLKKKNTHCIVHWYPT